MFLFTINIADLYIFCLIDSCGYHVATHTGALPQSKLVVRRCMDANAAEPSSDPIAGTLHFWFLVFGSTVLMLYLASQIF